jgi:hypothetical protein
LGLLFARSSGSDASITFIRIPSLIIVAVLGRDPITLLRCPLPNLPPFPIGEAEVLAVQEMK